LTPSPLDRRTFLALLAAGTTSLVALPFVGSTGGTPAAAAAPGSSPAADGVVRLGRAYLRDHPTEADVATLRSLVPGLDAARPVRPQLPALVPASVDDFAAGRITYVDGWHLAVTEARASAAVALGA
jgi:hypothetical protein